MLQFSYCYAECHYAECRYAECCYAEWRYAECRYAECRGAIFLHSPNIFYITGTVTVTVLVLRLSSLF